MKAADTVCSGIVTRLDAGQEPLGKVKLPFADEIAAARFCYDQLTESSISYPVEYLLRFEGPLSVVQDQWISAQNVDYSDEFEHMLWTIKNDSTAEQDYPLDPEWNPAPPCADRKAATFRATAHFQISLPQMPDRVMLAGASYRDEDGWCMIGFPLCDYLYFQLNEEGHWAFLFSKLEYDCFPGSPLFWWDMVHQMLSMDLLRLSDLSADELLTPLAGGRTAAFFNHLGETPQAEQKQILSHLARTIQENPDRTEYADCVNSLRGSGKQIFMSAFMMAQFTKNRASIFAASSCVNG